MSNVTVQEALKSIELAEETGSVQYLLDALNDCKASLSEIEKCEPVGHLCESPDKIARIFVDKPLDILNHTNTPLYTSPQPREWVSLTSEQITNIGIQAQSLHQVARLIESELKQQNTKG